jgi:hypothetical protein
VAIPAGKRLQDGLKVFDLGVQRFARVLVQNSGNIVIQLGVLAVEGHHRNADHGQNELQLTHVLTHMWPELVMLSGLSGLSG